MKQRGPERPFSSMDEHAADISSEICCYYFTTRSTSVLLAFRQESGTTSWAHTFCYWKSAGVYVCVHVHLILKDQMHAATLLDRSERSSSCQSAAFPWTSQDIPFGCSSQHNCRFPRTGSSIFSSPWPA